MFKNKSFFNYLKWLSFLSPIIIGIVIITEILISYHFSLESLYKEWEKSIVSQQKFIIKREVDSIVDMIDAERKWAHKKTKEKLREQTNEIYLMIKKMYEKNKTKMSRDEILKLVVNNLKNQIKNKEYASICLINLKGKRIFCNTKSNGEINNLSHLITSIKTRGQKVFVQQGNRIVYLDLFKPLDLVIATSVGLIELDRDLQREILRRLLYFKFGKDGYIFVLDSEGQILSHQNKNIIGKYLGDLKQGDGEKLLSKFTKIIKGNGGGYIRYVWDKPTTGKPTEKISYVVGYKPWNWIIGRGTYLDDIAGVFKLFKNKVNSITKKNLILSLLCLIIILVIFWFIFRSLVFSSAKDLEKLISFFKKAETEDLFVEEDRLNFSEFKDLGIHVNRMLGKKLQIQKRLLEEKELLNISEQRYKSLINDVMDSSNVGLFILDKDFHIVWVNKALEKLFFLKREDVIGRDKIQLIKEKIANFFENPDEFKNRVIACYKNNTYVENFVCHMLPGNGRKERWLEHWSCPIKSGLYKGGRVEHYTDITEKIKAYTALQESEGRLRSLFNAMTDMIFEIDREGRYLFVMIPDKEDILGDSPEEMVGRSIFDYLPKDVAEERMKAIARSLDDKKVVTLEYCLTIKGKEKWFEARISPKSEDSVLIVSRNITEKKKMELELLEREENLKITLNSIAEGVIVTDTQGKILRVNPSATKFLNMSKDDLVGENINELISCRDYDSKKDLICPVLRVLEEQRGISHKDTIEIVTKFNTTIPVDLTASPIKPSSNPQDIKGVVIVFNDISEKIKREEYKLNLEKMRSISVLAGGIAHDFNNMLMGIFGNIELAKMKLAKDSPAYERLEASSAMLEKARGLTSQLLTFAKGGDPVFEPMDLESTIKETIKFHLSGSNVKPVLDIDPDLWMLKGDKSQIVQVISNIVINAKEAMPNGGKLYVEVRNILDKSHKYYSHIKITIRDEGVGIPDKYLNRIFEPYFTTKQMGSGLGLAIVYSIIKKHKGHIEVYSTPGEGTTFIIYLPAIMASKKLYEDKKSLTEITEKIKGKVLVMDDEDMIAELCKIVLEDMGLLVDICRSGEEVISQYENAINKGEKYDLVIMDLTIPGGMGGKEAINKILEIDPHVKAIVSSGYSNDPVMNNFSKYGFSGRLVKPFKLDDLKKEVLNILSS